MKNIRNIFFFVLSLTFILTGSYACMEDNVGENYVTFKGELVSTFLEKDPQYSEFTALLKEADVFSLLKSYGHYTCFVPTNNAMKVFYQKEGKSLQDFTKAELKKIAFYHLIDGKSYATTDFVEGRIPTPNMGSRFIDITFSDYQGEDHLIKVNKTSPILIRDQDVENGIIHTVGEVLEGSDIVLGDVIAVDERFSFFGQALELTGMIDSLRLIEDEKYVQLNSDYPEERKYGYTALIESDAVYRENGINNFTDLKNYAKQVYDRIYPEDAGVADPTDRRNSLNRFVSYHLIDKWVASSEFVYNYNFNLGMWMSEYYETLCPNTLIEASAISDKSKTVYFNRRRNDIYKNDGNTFSIGIIDAESNNSALNGVYHAIDKILVYDEGVENNVLNRRLRFDLSSFLPELTNNSIRWKTTKWLPVGYCNNLIVSNVTEMRYAAPNPTWMNLYGDEFETKQGTSYDVTIVTPPVPAGTWEIRFSFTAVGHRGVAQMYFDGMACGIPLDIAMAADNPGIGWISDKDPGGGSENDKAMRNRGYIKGSASYHMVTTDLIARDAPNTIRRIVTTVSFDKTEKHYLRLKSVGVGTFHCDYIEFMPTGPQLDMEDIY